MSSDDDDNFSLKSNDSSEIEVRKTKKAKVKGHESSDDDCLSISSDLSSVKENSKKDNKKKPAKSALKEKKDVSKSKSSLTLTSTSSVSASSLPSSKQTTKEASATIQAVSTSTVVVSENSWRGPDITTESSAKALITKYLMHQNRPYSVIQIYENLHKRIQKPTIERCLNTLCESSSSSSSSGSNGNRVICKEYGKAKIYYPDQNCFQTISERDMKQLELEIDTLQREANKKQLNEQQLNAKLVSLSAEPSDFEIDREINEVEARLRKKKAVLSDMKSLGPVNPKDFENAVREHNKTRSLWKERKLNCMESVDLIADGMGKKLKVVLSEMGIETDEDAGVLPPATAIPEATSTSSSKPSNKKM